MHLGRARRKSCTVASARTKVDHFEADVYYADYVAAGGVTRIGPTCRAHEGLSRNLRKARGRELGERHYLTIASTKRHIAWFSTQLSERV